MLDAKVSEPVLESVLSLGVVPGNGIRIKLHLKGTLYSWIISLYKS